MRSNNITMREKVFFLTDAHLGQGADSVKREQELVTFLDSIAAEMHTLVLLGDIFDFWFTYKYVVPKGHTRILGKLAELSDNGVKIHYFIGNHDMWIFNYFQQEIGAIMHDGPEVMSLNDHRLLIGHGDGLENNDPHYTFLKHMFRSHFNQQLFAFFHPWIGFSIATKWSGNSRKRHPLAEQDYRGDEKEGIYQYAKSILQHEPYDYAIFGHRHGQIERPIHTDNPSRDAIYINVGNWIERRDYAVLDKDGLTLKQFSLR